MSLKEFFYFQRSDRKVLLVMLGIVAAALVVIYVVGENNSTTPDVDDSDTISRHGKEGEEGGDVATASIPASRLVYFDPNTADSTTLLALGLAPWQVRNICKYRAKGGVFHRPEDFARVYGLTVGKYRELEPYIRIGDDYRLAADVYGQHQQRTARHDGYPSTNYHQWQARDARGTGNSDDAVPVSSRDTLRFPVKMKPGQHVDLNTADTTLLKRIPGIGSYYARRVVAYRERLGGFCALEQLFDIEGFPEEALDFMTLQTPVVRKINLNKLSLSQLRQHPYINFYQAKAITDYRRLKGPLSSLDDLSLLPDFPADAIRKLAPYVEF